MRPDHPEPLIVPPLRSHKQTFILLHGRGSSSATFGPDLLNTHIPGIGTLPSAFPHARFVFPTACKQRATIYKRSVIRQWFNNWTLEAPTEYEELQVEGLRETVLYVHHLLKQEIKLVRGPQNVVFGGLSQGCAASLTALLLWDGEPLAAAVGMCGWLPFRGHIEDTMQERGDADEAEIEDEEFNPFAESPGENGAEDEITAEPVTDPVLRGVNFLRGELEMSLLEPSSPLPFPHTPLFLGHGTEDEKVFVHLGKEAAKCLGALGVDVSWKEYQGLGHWYSADMLRDLVAFIRQRTGWE